MRILFYNWVQFDDWKLRGGGVSVYLKNIISDLINRPNIEITFLSSGQHYSIFNRNQPFIEETKNIYSNNGVRSFRIVNSEVKAPAHDMFFDLDIALRSESTKNIFRKFLEKYGPFDVIHFNNVEGISMNVFELKSEFENTKFILTAHNYHILCPQIELYYNGKEICKDFCSGNKCVTCIGSHDKLNTLKKYQALGSFIEKRKLEGKPLGDFFLLQPKICGIFSEMQETFCVVLNGCFLQCSEKQIQVKQRISQFDNLRSIKRLNTHQKA